MKIILLKSLFSYMASILILITASDTFWNTFAGNVVAITVGFASFVSTLLLIIQFFHNLSKNKRDARVEAKQDAIAKSIDGVVTDLKAAKDQVIQSKDDQIHTIEIKDAASDKAKLKMMEDQALKDSPPKIKL